MAAWNRAQNFPTTQWTKVLAAARDSSSSLDADQTEAREALAWLCDRYWQPLYRYTVSRCGDADLGKDLTQEFVATLIERQWLDRADPQRGKFRAFLLTALKRFLAQEYRAGKALKRGGGASNQTASLDAFEQPGSSVPEAMRDELTPDILYERQWALSLLGRVTDSLQKDFADLGRANHFACLKEFLTADGDVRQAAAQLGVTENAARVAIHRLRKQFRARFFEEIERTVSSPEEAREEARYLLEVLVSTRGIGPGASAQAAGAGGT